LFLPYLSENVGDPDSVLPTRLYLILGRVYLNMLFSSKLESKKSEPILAILAYIFSSIYTFF